jgi:hypothetical protein
MNSFTNNVYSDNPFGNTDKKKIYNNISTIINSKIINKQEIVEKLYDYAEQEILKNKIEYLNSIKSNPFLK